jgi:dipeptidyl aminopeptidase/acylaminoacyl peptidase
MRRIAVALLGFVVCAQGQDRAKELEPVSFLVGSLTGEGSHPLGRYDETLRGEWSLNRTVIVVRSRSAMEGRTVYEDLRVFSYDPTRKVIRMRQYGLGDVAVYDVRVEDGGKRIVLQEVAHEGNARGEWRYTYRRKGATEFEYQVDARHGDAWKKYVAGSLRRGTPDPARLGAAGFDSSQVLVERKEGKALGAMIHRPEGAGPFPVIVFSPGGPAASTQGYDGFGRMFASWGYLTVVVAFNDPSAEERAGKFGEVLDWLAGAGAPLQGKADLTRAIAAGHSMGGFAAVLAAHADARFKACVALAPSGPDSKPPGENRPALCVIVGDRDSAQETCRAVFERAGSPRYLVTIEDMNHFFAPRTASRHVLSRAVAFLNYRVLGDDRYRAYLLDAARGVAVEAEEASTAK